LINVTDSLLINNLTTEHCPNLSVRFCQMWRTAATQVCYTYEMHSEHAEMSGNLPKFFKWKEQDSQWATRYT